MEQDSKEMDRDLKESLRRDLDLYVATSDSKRHLILLFPAINSYTRLRLHETVRGEYPLLTSFSVGTEPNRVPIVSRQDSIAAWTASQAVVVVSEPEKATTGTKRPDKAIYVPRALRNKEVVVVPKPPPTIKVDCENSSDLIRQVEAVIGPVCPISPLTDYLALETGCVTSKDIVFRRVVEMWSFPQELKTSDLEDVLHRGLGKLEHYYDLRWVDDTHALAVFADESNAMTALAIKDVHVKFRPFYEASEQSKAKALTFGLQDEVANTTRPDTSTVLAKRLLSRALGMPGLKATAKEEDALKEARLQRRSVDEQAK